MDFIQIAVILILFVLLTVIGGSYVYKVLNFQNTKTDFIFDKIDNFIYKISGIDKDEEMTWKKYLVSLLTVNIAMIALAYVILKLQGMLFMNPNGAKAMGATLSFNTVISFITNTNLQHYAGESAVSYLSQMLVMTFMMFTSAATGYAAVAAFIRGLVGKKTTVGNFFVDITRVITRILLPLAIVVSLILVWQGVPQTFNKNKTVTTIEKTKQDIALGPVASLESIKHIGTNGGGFFSANSAHPFENPNPITNVIEIFCMMLLPGSIVYAFGLWVKNKKQGWAIFIAMAVLFMMTIPIIYTAEKAGNPQLAHIGLSQAMGNMEGKEVRFGIAQSSIFTSVTTAFTTGSVNTMHDSLMPLGGLVPLWNMFLNVVFGGKGIGFMNMIMYAIITVFICGLMVGRTPEFLEKKIEGKEVKLIALAILINAFIVLIPEAITLVTKAGYSSITNHGYHGLTQSLYEIASAAANNGSTFAGLKDTTAYWNIMTGIIMLIGRYMPIIILLAVSGSLASKQPVPENIGTFRTDNSLFVITLIFIVIVIGALTFLPAIALGPIAEHLTIGY